MRTVISALFLAGVVSAAPTALAANHYVRSGATGNNTGASWTDACAGFSGACAPSAMIRGDTYYVANGSYPAVLFNKAASGTLVITVKKATVADHGTEVGWSSSYGDGQATFASPVTFSSSYWVFDGSTRNESNWFNGAAYGFKISNNANAAQRQIIFGAPLSNLTIKYTWAEGRTGSYTGSERRYSVDCETSGTSTDLLFHRMLVTHSNQHWFVRNTNRATIEYNAADGISGDEYNHAESINLYFTAENSIIRFNQFRDIGAPGWSGVTNIIAIADARNSSTPPNTWIYGNVAYRFSCGDGAFGFSGNSLNDGNCKSCRVMNNTIIDGAMVYYRAWGIQFPQGDGNVAQNNLFFSGPKSLVNDGAGNTPAIDIGSNGTLSHNAYGPGANGAGTNAQNNVPISIFGSYANDDFRLATATAPGVAITGTAPDGAPLNVDMFGCIRGADGTWDRGAFEFPSCVKPPGTVPSAPSNVKLQ